VTPLDRPVALGVVERDRLAEHLGRQQAHPAKPLRRSAALELAQQPPPQADTAGALDDEHALDLAHARSERSQAAAADRLAARVVGDEPGAPVAPEHLLAGEDPLARDEARKPLADERHVLLVELSRRRAVGRLRADLDAPAHPGRSAMIATSSVSSSAHASASA
jgi:hypothetical protein